MPSILFDIIPEDYHFNMGSHQRDSSNRQSMLLSHNHLVRESSARYSTAIGTYEYEIYTPLRFAKKSWGLTA